MVNPYLMQAVLLKALDDGIKNRIDPGEPEDRNFVDVLNSGETIERIPTTLHDALDALAEDDVIRSALPGDLYREPLAKLSIDSGRRKSTEVSILGGA